MTPDHLLEEAEALDDLTSAMIIAEGLMESRESKRKIFSNLAYVEDIKRRTSLCYRLIDACLQGILHYEPPTDPLPSRSVVLTPEEQAELRRHLRGKAEKMINRIDKRAVENGAAQRGITVDEFRSRMIESFFKGHLPLSMRE